MDIFENDDGEICGGGDDSSYHSNRQNSNDHTEAARTSAYEIDRGQSQHLVDNGLWVSG